MSVAAKSLTDTESRDIAVSGSATPIEVKVIPP